MQTLVEWTHYYDLVSNAIKFIKVINTFYMFFILDLYEFIKAKRFPSSKITDEFHKNGVKNYQNYMCGLTVHTHKIQSVVKRG